MVSKDWVFKKKGPHRQTFDSFHVPYVQYPIGPTLGPMMVPLMVS